MPDDDAPDEAASDDAEPATRRRAADGVDDARRLLVHPRRRQRRRAAAAAPAMRRAAGVPLLAAGGGDRCRRRSSASLVWFVRAVGRRRRRRRGWAPTWRTCSTRSARGRRARPRRATRATLPPGFPADLPTYPGAKVVSSIAQVRGDDAGYLVIYDTNDARDKCRRVLSHEQFSADPWQIDGGAGRPRVDAAPVQQDRRPEHHRRSCWSRSRRTAS